MIKTLTEQWKNGELKEGWYFLEFENGSILPVYYCGFNREFEFRWDWKISKVLAPLPSYDQFSQLVKKVEKLEKQLKEANKVIKYYANSFWGDKQEDGTYLIYTRENALGRVEVTYNPNIANNYLEKWGAE